jgi:hypothetical protein
MKYKVGDILSYEYQKTTLYYIIREVHNLQSFKGYHVNPLDEFDKKLLILREGDPSLLKMKKVS